MAASGMCLGYSYMGILILSFCLQEMVHFISNGTTGLQTVPVQHSLSCL